MLDFRRAYRMSDEFVRWAFGGCVAIVLVALWMQSYVSLFSVVAVMMVIAVVIVALFRPLWILAGLAFYLPFESFILKFASDDVFLFARFFAEGAIYVLALIAIIQVVRKKSYQKTELHLPFIFLCIALLASSIVNALPVFDALVGIRQIIRFILVFFIVIALQPSKRFITRLTLGMFAVCGFQIFLALFQRITGGSIDAFLLPNVDRSLGDILVSTGVDQFWESGSRVFGTLGRYDRLGNFLYLFLLIAVALFYEKAKMLSKPWLIALLASGSLVLILTYSRASWFAFLLGFLFIAVVLKRDRRVAITVASFVTIAFSYLFISGLQVRFITELPGQTLVERFYETFSFTRWRGEYHGLGRTFWMVETVRTVVPAAPIFGFGPGQFGGGVASALRHTHAYDTVGLPFGVFGTEGIIDNNWFSLWGEIGTLGMIFYAWMFIVLFRMGYRLGMEGKNPTERALGFALCAMLLGVTMNAFLSTLFEIRTSAYYLWLYAGFVAVLDGRRNGRELT